VRTVQGRALDAPTLASIFGALRGEAQAWLAKQTDSGTVTAIDAHCHADMRYSGQSFTITTDVTAPALRGAELEDYAAIFHREHLHLFGHNDEKASVAFNELRVRLSGALPKPGAVKLSRGAATAIEPLRLRDLRHGGAWIRDVPIYSRDALPAGWSCGGAAIIEQDNATILVPPRFVARVGDYGDILLTRES
jgi:N-methylhydantoinase A